MIRALILATLVAVAPATSGAQGLFPDGLSLVCPTCLPLSGGTMTGPINMQLHHIYSAAGPLELGGDCTDGGTGDVCLSGAIDIAGTTKMEGNLTFASLRGITFFSATTYGSLTSVVDEGLRLALANNDGVGNHNFNIISADNLTKDHDHDTLSANPTLFINSATNPDSDNTQWVSIAHDQTDAVIASGKGGINFDSFTGGMRVSRTEVASPAEPVACAAGTTGTMVYVNDTDDGAAAELCICAGITNDATYDWVQVKDMTTACTFF